jgi:hypothetical protein|tara:strand:+ start:107 stop:697 length:591 start_codon:yes stop_codon:yes gene_type:complete
MASSIVTTGIDGNYPVAGQDNDSQGFRDNFSQIKTQLGTAATEITAIQANRATTDATTDFNGHDVKRANLQDWGQKIVAKGSVSGSVSCDFEDGNVVTLTTSGNTTLTFTNFPLEDDGTTNTYATMKLLVTKGTSTDTITLSGVSLPVSTESPDSSTLGQQEMFPPRKGVFVFEVFSVDGGTTKYASQVLEYPTDG